MIRLAAILVLLAICLSAYGNPQQETMMHKVWGVRGTVPSVDLTPNLLHFWSGANGTNDAGSVPQNLTLYGATTNTANGWDFGTADGNYFVVNGPISNGTSYTIAAWIKPNKTAMNLNGSGGWILADRTYPGYGLADFKFFYQTVDQKIYCFAYDRDGVVYFVGDTNAVVNDAWVHIAIVVDAANTNMVSYHNGVACSSGSLNASKLPVNNSTVNASISTASWDLGQASQKYHGMLDRIRFYGTAKPASFIQAIFNAEKASKGL